MVARRIVIHGDSAVGLSTVEVGKYRVNERFEVRTGKKEWRMLLIILLLFVHFVVRIAVRAPIIPFASCTG